MTESERLQHLDTESSVILLGSGFSLEATNALGRNPPNGKRLRRHFVEALRMPPDTDFDLQILADDFAENDPERLFDELTSLFRITELSQNQKKILGSKWRRIYTTNYDDCVEVFRTSVKENQNSYDVSDSIPNKLQDGSVVHLHGSLREMTPDNVKSSIILGETSYINQYMQRSPWFDQFQKDISFASNLFIVGYSLSDYHIATLLMMSPSIAQKTIFIQGPLMDEMFLRRTKDYGRTFWTGLDGFAEILETTPRLASASDILSLRNFRPLSPANDKQTKRPPTANEVYDLIVYGKLIPARLFASLPSEDYVIRRKIGISHAIEVLESSRSLIVDSRIGNGKTVYLYILSYFLSELGYNCLIFKNGSEIHYGDIEFLKSVKRLVIFFEQYGTNQVIIRGLADSLPNAKFVVEIRTSIFEVRYHEVSGVVPKPFGRVTLNKLNQSEVEALHSLCKRAGINVSDDFGSRGDLREILLQQFRHPTIRNRVVDFLTPIFNSRVKRKIMIMSMLTAVQHGAIESYFLRSILGVDPYSEFKSIEEVASELFDTSSDDFKVRSPVFAEFVVDEFVEPNEIADCVVEIILAASTRRKERSFRVLMASMMAYSNLKQSLRRQDDVHQLIKQIYERIRNDVIINDEPLFWLQYAILSSEMDRLDLAKSYISSAYDRAGRIEGFETYQIDTQAFRIALLSATRSSPGSEVVEFDEIIETIEKINNMISEESHRFYAVRVLEHIPAFIASRFEDLSTVDQSKFVYWIHIVLQSLERLHPGFKAASGSDQIKSMISTAVGAALYR